MRAVTKQTGFAFMEVVFVIAILAMLAAFAIPRLVSLERESRAAATEAMAGSVRSGAALAHALWLASGSDAVTIEGRRVAIADGYPTLLSIEDAVPDARGFTYARGVWTNSDAKAPEACTVTYATPRGAHDLPRVTAITTGC